MQYFIRLMTLFVCGSLFCICAFYPNVFGATHELEERNDVQSMALQGSQSSVVFLWLTASWDIEETTWTFDGERGKTCVEFLKGGMVRFSDSFYGTEGHWSRVQNQVLFDTAIFSFRGIMFTGNEAMRVTIGESGQRNRIGPPELKYVTMERSPKPLECR